MRGMMCSGSSFTTRTALIIMASSRERTEIRELFGFVRMGVNHRRESHDDLGVNSFDRVRGSMRSVARVLRGREVGLFVLRRR